MENTTATPDVVKQDFTAEDVSQQSKVIEKDTSEEVKNDKEPEAGKESDELFNKRKELERKNQKLQEMETKLNEYEAEKKAEHEKELKKKGKQDEIILERDKQIEELSKYKEFYEAHEVKRTEELTTKLKDVPSDKKEVVDMLLEKVESIDEKHKVIDAFIAEKESFWKQPTGKSWHEVNKHVEAQKKGDIQSMIASAPRL